MDQIEHAAPGRILYFDTDSVIFVSRSGVTDPPTGNFLGDLTNELKPGQHIQEFVSLGPKTYGYQTNDGKTCVKVKGFTLNGATDEAVNFNSLLKMLDQTTVTLVPQNYLKRNLSCLQISDNQMSKKCKFTYSKRRIVDADFNTLPFGYCD